MARGEPASDPLSKASRAQWQLGTRKVSHTSLLTGGQCKAVSAPPFQGVIQRAPAKVLTGEALWDDVQNDFEKLVLEMASLNQQYFSSTRATWGERLNSLWAWTGAPGERADEELRELKKTLSQARALFDDENTAAFDLWKSLLKEYQEETIDLAGSELPEAKAARQVLEKEFKAAHARVEGLGEFLVPEDLIPLYDMLEKEKHIAEGYRVAQKERDRERQLEKRHDPNYEEDMEEEPSALGIAWDVVGWDSPADFAADIALTAVTFGIGKFVKWTIQGRKAKKRLDKIQKLRELRKTRKATRLKKIGDAIIKLVADIAWVLENFEFVDHAKWVKGNWKKIAKAYITDEIGHHAGGGKAAEKNLLERVSKDMVALYVETTLRVSSDEEGAFFKSAVLGFASGDKKWGRHKLAGYFKMNLKRRLTTNAVYEGIRVGAIESKLSANSVIKVATATVGEMADDLLNRVSGFGAVGKAAIEVARKALVTAVNAWIKRALD